MEPQILVSLNDAVLYAADLELLGGNSHGWLNDQCLLFWQQYLELVKFTKLQDLVVYLQPAAAFSLQFLDLEDLLVDSAGNVFRKLKDAKLVLVPLVADAHAEAGGGSHWTLLVYYAGMKHKFFHVDSSNQTGEIPFVAVESATKLAQVLHDENPKELEIIHIPCPQQRNGYDCGVHVCANAEAFYESFKEPFDPMKVPLPISVQGKRKEMLEKAREFPPKE